MYAYVRLKKNALNTCIMEKVRYRTLEISSGQYQPQPQTQALLQRWADEYIGGEKDVSYSYTRPKFQFGSLFSGDCFQT